MGTTQFMFDFRREIHRSIHLCKDGHCRWNTRSTIRWLVPKPFDVCVACTCRKLAFAPRCAPVDVRRVYRVLCKCYALSRERWWRHCLASIHPRIGQLVNEPHLECFQRKLPTVGWQRPVAQPPQYERVDLLYRSTHSGTDKSTSWLPRRVCFTTSSPELLVAIM